MAASRLSRDRRRPPLLKMKQFTDTFSKRSGDRVIGRLSDWAIKEIRMQYLVVVERGESSYGAYVPDLPGCIAVGETREEALRLIREAIEMHLASMREDGVVIPEPKSTTEYVQI